MSTMDASSRPALSPRGSIGDSAISKSTRVPNGCLRRGATLMTTRYHLLANWFGAPLLEHFEALFHDRERLHKIALAADGHVGCVRVGATHRLVGFGLGLLLHVVDAGLGVA